MAHMAELLSNPLTTQHHTFQQIPMCQHKLQTARRQLKILLQLQGDMVGIEETLTLAQEAMFHSTSLTKHSRISTIEEVSRIIHMESTLPSLRRYSEMRKQVQPSMTILPLTRPLMRIKSNQRQPQLVSWMTSWTSYLMKSPRTMKTEFMRQLPLRVLISPEKSCFDKTKLINFDLLACIQGVQLADQLAKAHQLWLNQFQTV